MTDFAFIQKEFRSEIRDRKSVGYSARNRICGSKSKRAAKLPSDSLTPKQWKEKNGPVTTYNLSRPMSWQVFSAMPADLQRDYLTDLTETHHLTQVAVARIFGISPKYCSLKLRELGFADLFPKGRRMHRDDEQWLRGFLSGGVSTENEADAAASHNQNGNIYDVIVPDAEKPVETPARPMQMSELSVRFDGRIDLTQVMNTLRYMLPDGDEASVQIVIHRGGFSHEA